MYALKKNMFYKNRPSFVGFFFLFVLSFFLNSSFIYVNCIRIVCITCLLLYGRVSLHEYEEHKGCKWTLLNKEIKKQPM